MAKNNGNEKCACLDQFTTAQLEALLRNESERTDGDRTDVVFHILEVIEKREQENPTGRLPDEDKAWAEFQQYYNIPEGDGQELYGASDEPEEEPLPAGEPAARRSRRLKTWLKQGLIAAAVVVALFAPMVVAQAAGLDVFGALGRWTDEHFGFVVSSPVPGSGSTSRETEDPLVAEFRAALEEHGIYEDLVPTWYPEGFEPVNGVESVSDSMGSAVWVTFLHEDGRSFMVSVDYYNAPEEIENRIFEKDDTPVEEYLSNGKNFYLLSNLQTDTATWSQGNLVWSIQGKLSQDEIKNIIDSIGG